MASVEASGPDGPATQVLDDGSVPCSPKSSSLNEIPPPIFRLPDELLLVILKQVQTLNHAEVAVPDYLQWMKLVEEDDWVDLITPSHVCRQWRTIAMGCPTLWSRIILSKPAITEEMLSRSSPVPLSIAIQDAAAVDHILPSSTSKQLLDTERLERLHLSLSTNYLQRILDSVNTETTFPYLRSLFIHDSDRWTASEAGADHYPYTVPAHILSMPMPRLQDLYISYCTIPWDSLQHCQSLVSLRLDRVSRPSRTQFYSLLASNADLETLFLKSALPRPLSETIKPAELPNLSSCEIIEATVPECLDFQTHVSYAIDKVKIRFWASEIMDVINISTNSAFLSACQESFHHPRSSCLSFQAHMGIPRIVVSPIPSSKLGIPSSEDEFFCSIDFTGYNITVYDDRRYRWLELLSVPHVEKLIANTGSGSVSEADWLEFFYRHPGITTLRICEYSTRMMLRILSNLYADTPGERSTEEEEAGSENLIPCLPNLVTVELDSFAAGYASDSEEFARLFELLRQCFSKRRDYGLQLQQLKLWSCQNISSAAVEVLENDVERVMYMDAE